MCLIHINQIYVLSILRPIFLTVPKLLAFAVNMKIVKTAERQMVALNTNNVSL